MNATGLPFAAEFPAHAGMNRPLAPAAGDGARVPRTRGDEPTIITRLRDDLGSSPHTRG